MEPIRVHPQIVYKGGKPVSVILSIEEFEALLEAAEDLDDIAYLHSLKEEELEFVPFDDYLRRQHGSSDPPHFDAGDHGSG